MRRREFIMILGGAAATLPPPAGAQPPARVHRVGLILTTSPLSELTGPDPIHPLVRAFVHGLRDLGYVEGQNLILERRSAEGRFERFAEIVEAGIVASLARPGGNITGFTVHPGPEFEAKRLQLLKEALPEATRVALLGLKSTWEGPDGKHVRAAARVLGVTLVHAEHTPTDYAEAFALMTRDRPHALFVARHAANYANRQLILDFAADHRLPGIFPWRENVEAGGLMSYGLSTPDVFRRAAGHVDKILKGAKPADLPVEQPTRFELVINLKTAKGLGMTVPPALLASADEVIE
jgi:putative tryptophan/tyrosine transport system substrate-binding protein